jgi:hypothetical protein
MTTRLCELQSFRFYLELITNYERSACAAPDNSIAPPRAFAVAPSRSIANAPSKAYVWMSRVRAGLRRIMKYYSPKMGGIVLNTKKRGYWVEVTKKGGYRVK